MPVDQSWIDSGLLCPVLLLVANHKRNQWRICHFTRIRDRLFTCLLAIDKFDLCARDDYEQSNVSLVRFARFWLIFAIQFTDSYSSSQCKCALYAHIGSLTWQERKRQAISSKNPYIRFRDKLRVSFPLTTGRSIDRRGDQPFLFLSLLVAPSSNQRFSPS